MCEILLFTRGNSWVFVNETCCQTEQKSQPYTVDDANEHIPPHRRLTVCSLAYLGQLRIAPRGWCVCFGTRL